MVACLPILSQEYIVHIARANKSLEYFYSQYEILSSDVLLPSQKTWLSWLLQGYTSKGICLSSSALRVSWGQNLSPTKRTDCVCSTQKWQRAIPSVQVIHRKSALCFLAECPMLNTLLSNQMTLSKQIFQYHLISFLDYGVAKVQLYLQFSS